MSKATRSLIATIAAFCAAGLFFMALVYWAFFATPPFNLNIGAWDIALRVLLIGAVVAFIVYLLITPESVGQAASKRSTRLTANALVASLVAVGIGILLNVIIQNVPVVRADLTAAQDFTLSEQTKKVLQELPRNVSAIAFMCQDQRNFQCQDGATIQRTRDLLREYQSHSNRFDFEFVDPFSNPATANRYNISRAGVVVFTDGPKREVAETANERDFTSALVRLLQEEAKNVAFLTGHGERDPSNFEARGYSSAREALQEDNYNALVWSLVTSPTLTVDDADVLVIAGPTRALPDRDVQTIQQYLDAGGSVMLLLDPEMPDEALASLRPILDKYGVQPRQGLVVDLQKRFTQDPTYIGFDTYLFSEIAGELARNRLPTGFPLSMGLVITPTAASGLRASPIMQTSAAPPLSWLETNTTNQQWAFDADTDLAGPVTVGVAVGPDVTVTSTATETQQIKTRLVVYGDADFASNLMMNPQVGLFNRDLFANSVSWLAGADELVSIRPKEESGPRTVVLTTEQKNMIFAASVLGLPLAVFLLGLLNWWRRR